MCSIYRSIGINTAHGRDDNVVQFVVSGFCRAEVIARQLSGEELIGLCRDENDINRLFYAFTIEVSLARRELLNYWSSDCHSSEYLDDVVRTSSYSSGETTKSGSRPSRMSCTLSPIRARVQAIEFSKSTCSFTVCEMGVDGPLIVRFRDREYEGR